MTISGDGLIFECINGMMSRPDWKDLADSLIFGFIPAGTGNGLVKSVTAVSDPTSFSIEEAAFTVVKGRKMGLDLTEIELEYQPATKIYMFLSLSWGYIADCDINSEAIRWAGPTRMTLWGIYRIMARQYYNGTFTYSGARIPDRTTRPDFVANPPAKQTIAGTFGHLIIQNIPYISFNMHSCPLSRIDDGVNDITIHMGDKSRAQLTQFVLDNDKGTFFDKYDKFKPNGMDYYKCLDWELKPEIKGPPPKDSNIKVAEGVKVMDNAIYAIDGERYPAQDVKGRVLPRVLTIYY